MPRRYWRTRGRRPLLSPCMLFYLATGKTHDPTVSREIVDSLEYGHLPAFLLSGKVNTYLHISPARTHGDVRAAVDAVRELYEAHRDEIEEAARAATDGQYLSYAAAILAKADEIEGEQQTNSGEQETCDGTC